MTVIDWNDLPDEPRRQGDYGARWLLAGAVILAVHAGGLYLAMRAKPPAYDTPAAAVMIDLAALPVSAPSETDDVAPGPQMVQAPQPMDNLPEDLEESTPPPQPVPEPLLELPELPPPPPLAEALLPPPKPAEAAPEPPPKPVEKPKPKPTATRKPPAPATSAAPRSDAPQANATAAPTAGVSSANSMAPANWRSLLMAQIHRMKRYPSEARTAREEGIARVRFSIDRSGKVLAASLVSSSGSASLDGEALALMQRISPVPAPPPEQPGSTITLTVPINFSLR